MKPVSIYDAIFPGKGFIDCAIAVRKMKSMSDLVPEMMRSLKLSQRDIDLGPLKVNQEVVDRFLTAIPDHEDDPIYGALPDQVSNELHGKLCNVALANFFKGREMEVVAAFKMANADERSELWNRGVMVPVSALTRQVSFLWSCFRLGEPQIDVLTKDAFDLVAMTKLDANVTEEMVETAFPRDVFLTMQKPLHGFREIAVLRRGNLIAVVTGRLIDEKYRGFPARPCAFVVMGMVDLVKQIGHMTRRTMSESIVEQHEENSRRLDEKLEEMGIAPEYRQKVKDTFDKSFVGKPEQDEAAGIVADLAMFAMKLRLMMTAEKSPVEMVRSVVGASSCHDGVGLPPERDGLSFSVISLTKEYRDARSRGESSGEKLDKVGRKMVEKTVGAFLRRQHFGQGNKLVKYVWIAPFTNRFWVRTGIKVTKVIK